METFNDISRFIVVEGLDEVPEVGGLLSGIVAILWPSSTTDLLAEIQSWTEALIDQKLAEQTDKDVKATLIGLQQVVKDYQTNVKGKPSDSVAAYTAAEAAFDAAQPHFMDVPGSELLLLPLTAQLANLHLSLLRDGVLFGEKWGRDQSWVKAKKDNLSTQIQKYVDFAHTWFINGYITAGPLPKFHREDLDKKIYGDLVTRSQFSGLTSFVNGRYRADQWSFRNKYVREMTLSVLDYAVYWPSFDPDTEAARHLPSLTRELYSNAEGIPDSDHYVGVNPPPAQPITGITVWAADAVTAVQVAYGGTAGPRMGRPDGAVPAGWKAEVTSTNPVVQVDGQKDLGVNQLQFTFKDGTQTIVAGNQTGGHAFKWHIPGHRLSSIYITGPSTRAPAADCVIFGFRRRHDMDKPATPLTKTPMAGTWNAGINLFDYFDEALAVSKLWVNADGDKIRGLAWQYRVGNAIRIGDVPQDLSSLKSAVTLEAGQGVASMVLKDSVYGYGSVQRIEITMSNGSVWSAGVDGGHPTPIQCAGQRLAGFYGSVNSDNFINSLGAYLKPL